MDTSAYNAKVTEANYQEISQEQSTKSFLQKYHQLNCTSRSNYSEVKVQHIKILKKTREKIVFQIPYKFIYYTE